MNKFFVFLAVLVAGFIAYIKYVRQKEKERKLKESGENLAKGLHGSFINSVSPNLRESMKINAHVEKLWRWERFILKRFSRVVIEIFLLSEEISEKEVGGTAKVFLRESTKNNGKFLVGLKITKTNQENERGEIWKERI